MYENKRDLEDLVIRMVLTDSFDQVEVFIDTLELDDDYKAGLWLLAWAELPRQYRRRVLAESRR